MFHQADQVLGFALTKLMFEGPDAELEDTINAQPAILTLSVACLAALTGNPTIAGTGEAGALVELFANASSTPAASAYVKADGTWSLTAPWRPAQVHGA